MLRPIEKRPQSVVGSPGEEIEIVPDRLGHPQDADIARKRGHPGSGSQIVQPGPPVIIPRQQQSALAAQTHLHAQSVRQPPAVGFPAVIPDVTVAQLFEKGAAPHGQGGDDVGLIRRTLTGVAARGKQPQDLFQLRQGPLAQGVGARLHPVCVGKDVPDNDAAQRHRELLIVPPRNPRAQDRHDVVVKEADQRLAEQPAFRGRPGALAIEPGEIDRKPHRPWRHTPDMGIERILSHRPGAW